MRPLNAGRYRAAQTARVVSEVIMCSS
jgi:hypothetical protein